MVTTYQPMPAWLQRRNKRKPGSLPHGPHHHHYQPQRPGRALVQGGQEEDIEGYQRALESFKGQQQQQQQQRSAGTSKASVGTVTKTTGNNSVNGCTVEVAVSSGTGARSNAGGRMSQPAGLPPAGPRYLNSTRAGAPVAAAQQHWSKQLDKRSRGADAARSAGTSGRGDTAMPTATGRRNAQRTTRHSKH